MFNKFHTRVLPMKLLMKFVAIFVSLLILSACSNTPERHILPIDLTQQAEIPGVPGARFWADEWPKFSIERF